VFDQAVAAAMIDRTSSTTPTFSLPPKALPYRLHGHHRQPPQHPHHDRRDRGKLPEIVHYSNAEPFRNSESAAKHGHKSLTVIECHTRLTATRDSDNIF
jgi:hypothetical protein